MDASGGVVGVVFEFWGGVFCDCGFAAGGSFSQAVKRMRVDRSKVRLRIVNMVRSGVR